MTLIRSALFNPAFYLWTVLCLVACLPCLALPSGCTVRAQTFWAEGVLWLLRRIAGIELEIRGSPPAGAVLIASKHQSAWDTLIWHVIVRDPALVMKKELLAIPLYGWYCRKSRMIPVDREGGPRALKEMLRAAAAAADEGRPIIIFPEGTRTAPGRRLPYLPGVVALYRHLGIETVPVAVNSGLHWPRRSFRKRPGRIVLTYLEPIPPGLDRKTFMAELEQRIEAGTEALMADDACGELSGKVSG